MVLPEEIGDAAQDANRDRVMAWLDAGGSINDVDECKYTLLHCSVCGFRETSRIYRRHVALAQNLIALAPHRDVLAVRGLAQRGKLSTEDSVLNFLARLGDNGVVWHVLSFWRATN